MKSLLPLMRREWLQHRVGWALLLAIPLALALLLLSFGHVQIDPGDTEHLGSALPTVFAVGGIAATMALEFVVLWLASLIITSGLPRRDLADRSIEFWLSLPQGHAESLAAPLLVHLLIVPAVALAVGLVGGYAVTLVLVSRVAGVGTWLALPWAMIVPASAAFFLRLLAGLALATLWLSPLILATLLLTAWFRRWAWVVIAVGLGLGGVLLKKVFGQPLLSETVSALLRHAFRAVVPVFGPQPYAIDGAADVDTAFRSIPSWLLSDLAAAVRDLASPLLLGGLAVAAACFLLLMQQRQRGGGSS